MSATRIHYDGIDRQRLIAAVFARAVAMGKRRPSQGKLARALGISQPSVAYHIRRMKKADGQP